MTKKKQADTSRPAELRPKFSGHVTCGMLATPGHDIPCDQADCNRDAVWVMADHTRRYVRCELHLNYGSGE